MNVINKLVNYFFIQPLQTLYFHGPRILGCWSGLSREQICSELTSNKIQNGFWLQNSIECDILINNHFESGMKSIFTIIYLVFIFRILYTIILYIEHKMFFQQPTNKFILLNK